MIVAGRRVVSGPVWTEGMEPERPSRMEPERLSNKAAISADDVFVDLGPGEGSLVRRVAERSGCRGVAIEAAGRLVLVGRPSPPRSRGGRVAVGVGAVVWGSAARRRRRCGDRRVRSLVDFESGPRPAVPHLRVTVTGVPRPAAPRSRPGSARLLNGLVQITIRSISVTVTSSGVRS